MKKLVAILILVVGISTSAYASWGYKSSSAYITWNDYLKSEIKVIINRYQRNGDLTEDELEELTADVTMCMVSDWAFMVQSHTELIKTSMDIQYALMGMATDMYDQYKSGERTRSEYIEKLIQLAKIQAGIYE